jgi:hypothetical protein
MLYPEGKPHTRGSVGFFTGRDWVRPHDTQTLSWAVPSTRDPLSSLTNARLKGLGR